MEITKCVCERDWMTGHRERWGRERGREEEKLKYVMWEGVGFASTGGGISQKPEDKGHFLGRKEKLTLIRGDKNR